MRPLLHLNCHHQIVYAKFNFKVQHPPVHEAKMWHFQKADTNLVRKAWNQFYWERAFSILIPIRWYVFVIQLLRTYCRTSFRMRQLFIIIKIPWINNRII